MLRGHPESPPLECEKFLANLAPSSIHEGQISLTHGFLPSQAFMHELPSAFREWDILSEQLPSLIAASAERERLAALPILAAQDPSVLADNFLARASTILGNLAHAYYFNQRKGNTQSEDPLPPGIKKPWEQISIRLGRKFTEEGLDEIQASRTHYDTFLCNWELTQACTKIIDGEQNLAVELHDLKMLHAGSGTNAERVNNLTIAWLNCDLLLL